MAQYRNTPKHSQTSLQNSSIYTLDHPGYNWGQVIHSKHSEQGVRYGLSRTYEALEPTFKKTLKNSVEHTVCCDWFETLITGFIPSNIVGEECQLSENIFLLKSERRSRHYKQVWNLYIDGELWGVLHSDPYETTKIVGERISFQMNNDMLYRSDWLETYKYLLSSMSWTHRSTTRIDIAIDGAMKAYKTACKALNSNVIQRKGRTKLRTTTTPKGDISKFEIGSMKSDKYGKIYNKSNMLLKYEKPYIPEFWNNNALEIKEGQDVWRYEITLRSKIAKNYDWTRFDDHAYLASIARTETKNWFEYYYVGKDKNKHRQYKKGHMNIFNWTSIDGDLLEKVKAIKASRVFNAKRAILTLSKEQFFEGDHAASNEVINTFLSRYKDYHLKEWYEAKSPKWFDEWHREKQVIERSKGQVQAALN